MDNLKSRIKNSMKKIISFIYISLIACFLSINNVYAVESNTSSIDTFIDFVCDWLIKIGGVVALIGGVMFALSWQRDDAEGKSRALMTLMAGAMVAGIAAARGLFGL